MPFLHLKRSLVQKYDMKLPCDYFTMYYIGLTKNKKYIKMYITFEVIFI